MALGEFTKQLAQQAILTATKEPSAPTAAAQPDGQGAVILAQVNAMQKALKEGEELALTFQNGNERIRVFEIYFPSWQVAVLSGVDSDRSFVRVIVSTAALQVAARVARSQPGAKPARITLVGPKP
jgi:hypothetical protein